MTKEIEQPFVQLPLPNYLPLDKPEFLESEEERKNRQQEETEESPRVIIIDI
jgi:hypothetical protein